jgi:signal transduction histidine kinase/PAS domain-containing protein
MSNLRPSHDERLPPRARAPSLMSDRFLSLLHHVLSAWQALRIWLRDTTFVPPWLPARWRHPLTGYLVALLIDVVTASVTLLLITLSPVFGLEGVLLIAGVVLVALAWGAGPSLLATFVGTWLFEFVVLSPHFSWQLHQPAEWVDVVVLLSGGVGLSLLASQSARARRQAEEMARSLRAEQARSDLERLRLRTVLDVLPVGVFIADATGRILETNPACRAIWGEASPLVEAIPQYGEYKGWWPGTSQRVAPEEWALARALQQGEETLHEEIDIETFVGQRKTILNFAVPFCDATGAIAGGVVAILDISERKQLEAALRRSEREAAARAGELEAIFETLADGVLVYDADGRLLRYNTAASQILGLAAQPSFAALPLQAHHTRYVPIDAQGQPLPADEFPPPRILRGEKLTGAQTVDVRVDALDGVERIANMAGTPLRNAEGVITGAVSIMRDVTEQRRLEQHTREALDALLAMAAALVQVPEAAITSDPASISRSAVGTDPALLVVAERLAELTRRVLDCRHVSMAAVEPGTEALTPITVVGLAPEHERQWWASWHPPLHLSDDLSPGAVTALRAGEPVRLEAPLPIWQRLSPARISLLVPMQVGGTLVGILRVEGGANEGEYLYPNKQELIRAVARLGALVLERERLLRARAEARVRELALRKANERMDTFLGVAGHELKTPLASMKLGLQLAERRIGRLAQWSTDLAKEVAPGLELIARTQRQAERLERLVNDLLDVSRVQAGKLELHLEAADLAAVVRDAVEEQRQAAPARTIVLQLPDDLYVHLTADADRIGQVVTNYLTNALKYSPADHPIVVGVAADDRQARVWVRDEGPGLPAEEQERIWERFHRVEGIEVQSGSGVGLGLGLHICRTIIERHQGQVGVESAPGRGSTFWFTLPLAPTGEA